MIPFNYQIKVRGDCLDICVVDTSALIADTDLLYKLFWCKIIIHTVVIEELSKLSRKHNITGAKARKVENELFKMKNRGDFYQGIRLRYSIIQFDDRKPKTDTYLRFGFDPKSNDNILLCVAKELQDETNQKVTLLTGDKFVSLKAGGDINIEYVGPTGKNKKKRKGKNKGYYNKGNELALKKA